MSSGYVRQSAANIVTGNTIQASDFNNEYNQLQNAFDGSAGHDHTGGTGLSQKINLTTAVVGILPAANGGSGVNNSNTITISGGNATIALGGNTTLTLGANITTVGAISTAGALTTAGAFTTSGAFSLTLTATAATNVTLPISGTLLANTNNLSDVSSTSTARTNLGLAIGSNVQAFDADLSALAALSTTGMLARTGSATYVPRTLVSADGFIYIDNGDGVADAPSIGWSGGTLNEIADDVSIAAATTSDIFIYDGVEWTNSSNVATLTAKAASFSPQNSTVPATGAYLPSSNNYGISATSALALNITNPSSAVNRFNITGSATGNMPILSSVGSDTNIGCQYKTKGTGYHSFVTGNGVQCNIIDGGTSTVNFFQLSGGVSGTYPAISAQGGDSAVGLTLYTSGTGNINFFTDNAGAQQFQIARTASAVNYLQVSGSATTNAIPIQAIGSDTNISITLTPKGTGVLNTTGINVTGSTAPANGLFLPAANKPAISINGTESFAFDNTGIYVLASTARTLPSGTVSGTYLANPATTNPNIISVGVNTSSTDMIRFINGNGTVGKITTNASATTYATSSDYRLKENVTNYTDGLSIVNSLRPVAFNWKSSGQSDVGFIAHEVGAIVPNACSGDKDAVDSEGVILPQGVDTSFLVAHLVSAVQNLSARLAVLEGK